MPVIRHQHFLVKGTVIAPMLHLREMKLRKFK